MAYLASDTKDGSLLDEALSNILSFGDSTETANIVRAEWSDRIAALPKRTISRPANVPLLSAHPNPFNPITSIVYRVDEAGAVSLTIHNVAGQRVRRLVGAQQQPGAYTLAWDGLDDARRPAASGIYLVRLTTPTNTVTRRVTLLR